MKRIVLTLTLCLMLAGVLILEGCAGCEQDWSRTKSYTVDLTRTVTLYDCSGNAIKTWEIDGTIEDQGGSFRFMHKGKAVTIAGTVLIEEVEK